MKKTLLLLGILVAMTACSGKTVLTSKVDVLSFVNSSGGSQTSGDVNVPGSIRIYVPDADGNILSPDAGLLVDGVPVLQDLYGFAVELKIAVKNTGSSPITASADFRLARAADDANIYDGHDDSSLSHASISLAPGASGTVSLNAVLRQGDPQLDLVNQDGFRIGVELDASGNGDIHYEITSFIVSLQQKPFSLIPDD